MTISNANQTLAAVNRWKYTSTGGETSLSGLDDNGNTLSYQLGTEQLHLNGILLVRGVDYVATTGSSITGLIALIAGDVIDIVSTVSTVISGMVPLSTVTTKGDLIAASSSGTVTNLPVGADGTTLVANSSASTGVSWAGPSLAAGKNALINGGMDIWARGTSFSGNAYMADRWFCANAQSGSGQESTIVPTGFRYSMKIVSSASVPFISQPIETGNSIQFAGQNATFSAYVYTSVSATTVIDVQYSTSVDNAQAGSWTTITATSGGSAATSTSFTRVSGVFAIPSTAKSLNVRIYTSSNFTGSIYASGVQLELGSVPTAFSRAGGTLQGELAACQRYYYRATVASYNISFGMGQAYSTTQMFAVVPFLVPMRTQPTALEQSGTAADYRVTNSAFGSVNCSAVPTYNSASVWQSTIVATVASGLVAGNASAFQSTASNAFLGWSAEL